MFCTNCGQQIDDNSAFCPYCGVHTENGPSELQLPAIVGQPQSNEIVQDVYSQPEAYQQFAQYQQQAQQAQMAQQAQQQYQQAPNQQQGQFQQQTAYQQAPYGQAPQKVKKPINKKIFVILGIVVGVLALAVVGIFVFKKFFGKSNGNSYVYVTDSDINFVKSPKAEEAVELSSNKGDEVRGMQVFYSPEGKFIYFFTKIDNDDDTGTLNRVLTSKIGTKNMDQFIESIDSDIYLYNVKCLDEERVAYLKVGKDSKSLCVYDGETETKLCKECESYYVDDNLDYIVYLQSDEDEYGSDLYRAPVDDIENDEKLDSNVDYIYNSGDLSSFLYEKYDDEDYIYELYSVDAEGDTEHLYDDVSVYSDYRGEDESTVYYFFAGSDETIDPFEYVDIDTDDIWGYDDEEEKEYYEMDVYDLYKWEDGEISKLDEDVLSFDGFSNVLVYNKTDNIESADIDEDDVSWASDLKYLLNVDVTSENYILDMGTGNLAQLGGKADELWVDMDNHYSYYTIFTADGQYFMYDGDEKELYELEEDDGELSGTTKIESDCGIAGVYDDKIYLAEEYYENKKYQGFADFYEYSQGESKLIAEDVYASRVYVYDDGTVFAATDVDDDEAEMVMLKNGEEVDTIGDEVSSILMLEDGSILYIDDDDLYMFNGKESVKIDSDVLGIYPENEKSANAYLYYYESDYDEED